MLSLEPFPAMVNFTEVDTIFEEMGEGTVSEGNAAFVFRDLRVAPLGDDFSSIKLGHEPAE